MLLNRHYRLRLFCLAATTLSATFTLVLAGQSDEILLESFDPENHHIHTWKEMNDPVMGGRSTGSFSIDGARGVGVFEGHVVDVPFLHAPGFIQSRTVDHQPFPDISQCNSFKLTLRSHTDYTGYRFSFGNAHAPGGKWHAFGYKVTLKDVPTGDDFGDMILPFSEFTDYWDDATGDPIVTCLEDPAYCPTEKALRNLKTMAIWGEGIEGMVSLEIQSISAVGCASSSPSSSSSKHVMKKGRSVALRGWKNQQLLTTLLTDYLTVD